MMIMENGDDVNVLAAGDFFIFIFCKMVLKNYTKLKVKLIIEALVVLTKTNFLHNLQFYV